MLYFLVTIRETVGELEFKDMFTVQAADLTEADAKADKIMQTWRSDESSPVLPDEDSGVYEFGEIGAEIMGVEEIDKDLALQLNDNSIIPLLVCVL